MGKHHFYWHNIVFKILFEQLIICVATSELENNGQTLGIFQTNIIMDVQTFSALW